MPDATSPIVEEYCRLTPGSAALARRAREVFPSGITHDSRFLEPHGLFVTRARGSRKWDVDGREYVDYTGGHGALLLGHNHPAIVEAVARQAALGTHYGACHELELRWGQLVQQLVPSAERVRFTSSGTEATLLAIRLARAATGRPKLLRFLGHFHGWHDHMAFGVSSHFDGTPTPGVLPELAHEVVLVPPGDLAALRTALDAHPDLAAAIIEPTGASWGQVPVAPAFLTALRELTAKRGVLLIFDEVISGFRCAPGGAQAAVGITPDLTTLAKIVAGGLPGGAVAGRADVLDWLAFPATGAAPRDKVPHQGTFNANPLSAAAGIAALTLVRDTDVCERANRFAARLRDALNDCLRQERVNWVAYGTFSGFHLFTNPQNLALTQAEIESGRVDYRTLKLGRNAVLQTRLRLAMMNHGVEIFNWPGGPISAVHNDEDLERTVHAFLEALRALRREGLA